MTSTDYLETWGYLQVLKDILEGKARDAAGRTDEIGRKLTADYLKQVEAIRALQAKIQTEADRTP